MPGPPGRDRQTTAIPTRWCLVVGLVAGAASGMFGVGGGTIIVPGLVLLAAVPQKLATGTSLTAVVPISVAAAIGYAAEGEVDVVRAAAIAAGAVAGTLVGTKLLRTADDRWLQLGFAGLLVATAGRMFLESGAGAEPGDPTVAGLVALVALGVATGVLAGLFGVGGGIVIVPVLTIVGGLPVALAKGTSLLAILPPAVVGTIRNRAAGLSALAPAAVLGAAGIGSASLVSRWAADLDPAIATAAFAAFLLLIAARMAANALRR